jgi:hypothetical protein
MLDKHRLTSGARNRHPRENLSKIPTQCASHYPQPVAERSGLTGGRSAKYCLAGERMQAKKITIVDDLRVVQRLRTRRLFSFWNWHGDSMRGLWRRLRDGR